MMLLRLERSGGTIELGDRLLARGGEAAIYVVSTHQIGGRPLVTKIYHRPDAVKARKLAAMLDHRIGAEENGHLWLAWPTERLLTIDLQPACVGYAMPMVSGVRPIYECYNPGLRRRRARHFNYAYLLRAARNLAGTVHRIHQRGYVIGDLNERNVLVTAGAMVSLVDCDSWQIRDAGNVFRCCVGRPEYTAPEVQGLPYGQGVRWPEQDLFALAVLIWRLLMCGTHPFDGRYAGSGDPPSVEQRIRAGQCPYAPNGRTVFRPSAQAPPLQSLDKNIRNLMLRCFVDGHQNPRLRPDAETWYHVIGAVEGRLQVCSRNAEHVFRAGLRICPWCRHAERTGSDPFPGPPVGRPLALVQR